VEVLALIIPVILVVGIIWLSLKPIMPTKLKGLIYAVLGFGCAYLFRNDQGEGPFMRPVGIIVGATGVYFFFDGLKNEIISAINTKAKPEQDET
jgi:nitrogen fixation-related uncharacterized protein